MMRAKEHGIFANLAVKERQNLPATNFYLFVFLNNKYFLSTGIVALNSGKTGYCIAK